MNGSTSTLLSKYVKKIDHIAIAVTNLESSIDFHKNVLGLELVELRETSGKSTAMISAVMQLNSIKFVFLQGMGPDSQVSKYIEHYGPGVQHIAIEVDSLIDVSEDLIERGFEFDTGVIRSQNLTQIFSRRDPGSGLMIELIERTGNSGFSEENVQQLFEQLEESNSF